MRKWIFVALVLTGCTGPKSGCGGDVLVLWPNSQGSYEFQQVRLSTLSDPRELRGEAAQIFFESTMNESKGYSGDVARPNLTNSDGVCVPTDVKSSLAVSAYAQMEKLYQLDQRLGVANQIPWPRKVGIELRIRGDGGLIQNNAHYFSNQDVIGIVPYTLPGLPTAANLGVLAHEHFHAHFQHQVYNRLRALLDSRLDLESSFHPWASLIVGGRPEDVDAADIRSPAGVNSFVLRGWNEGLADLYAALYTRRPDFVRETLPQLLSRRDVSGPLVSLRTSEDFRRLVSLADDQKVDRVAASYEQGTALARLLYRVSRASTETSEEFLSRVVSRLPRVADRLALVIDREFLGFDSIVPILLEGLPLNTEICDELDLAIEKATMKRSFAECSGL